MRVYISHPLRGNHGKNVVAIAENKCRVDEICRSVSEKYPDVTILSPIHNFGYVPPLGPQDWVMKQCLRFLTLADELWVYGPWRGSEGCLMEIATAERIGIPVVFMENRRFPEGF